jgi:alpha-L-rhamnosidase
MELIRLKTLNMTEPLGIGAVPYFSWVLQSDEPQTMQKSFRLTVSDGQTTLWDTGVTQSGKSTFVPYGGAPLASGTRYTWTVRVTDSRDREAEASAHFETALLQRSDWTARWAQSPFPMGRPKSGYGRQTRTVLFRKGFRVREGLTGARLYATCRGAYIASLNGRRADSRILAPEHTVYEKYLCYQTYDVTPLLRAGENALGLHVGDGWYCCKGFTPNLPHCKPERAVLFQLELAYADGSRERVISDESVRAAQGPVLFSDLFGGEKYDANLEQPGWDAPGFDDSGWLPAGAAQYGYDNLTAQYGEPVRAVRELPVQKMYTSPKGETILDFGQVTAGYVRLRTDLPFGTVIRLDHFEVPDQFGNYFSNVTPASFMRGREQRTEFVSAGKPAVYEPLFSFQGFRYARVTCPAPVRAEDFTAVAISSEKEDVGTFSCSDGRLNRLYENTRWSQRANMISIPTDCPQREKAGWTGDIQIYAKTALLNEDATPFLTRWLQNLTCDQRPNGSVPIIVPLDGFYPAMEKMMGRAYHNKGPIGVAGWSDAAVLVPWSMYQCTGNDLILREQYESMKKWCGYIETTARTRRGKNKLPAEIDQYLWNTGFHFGEWLIPSLAQKGYGGGTKVSMDTASKYIAPLFGWLSIHTMALAAETVGQTEDAAHYGELAEKMKQAIAEGVIGKDGDMPVDLMGAYVLPLAFGLVPKQLQTHFADKLVGLLEQHGGCLDTGFLATPYLLDAFCSIGRRDLAYLLLLQEKCPSWLYEVKNGATTIWESYYAFAKNGKPLAISLNHYAFGCVDDWMFRSVAGLDSEAPGFSRILIRPQPDASLTWAKRSYMSGFGLIAVEWKKENGVFDLTAVIPCNTTARIVLPNGEEHETGSGEYHFSCPL